MTTATNTVPAKAGDIQLAPQTYQQSMTGLNAMVDSNASASGVVSIQPGQLSVVQVQAGKQYKLRKTGNPNQTPDDLIAVRHGDALHVRYADGSVVHFEGFFSTCTDSSVCSVNLASDSAAGSTLGADALSSGPVADDGMLVYAHGNPNVLMSMAQDQSGLSSAIQSAGLAGNVTYLAASPILGSSLFALLAAGGLAAVAGATTAQTLIGVPAIAEQDLALTKIGNAAASNNASGTATPAVAPLTIDDYTKAKVTGVNSTNLAAINSALDSFPIAKEQANTTAKLQIIVNAYTAILASADGTAGDTGTALTGEQYTAVGIAGVASGAPTDGSALKLLDEMVDKSANGDVNTIAKLQVKADAAAHLLAAAGNGTAADVAKLSVADLTALGISNVTADNIDAVRAAIKATPDASIDTLSEVKAIVDTAVAGIATALTKISTAAGSDNASGTSTPAVAALTVDDYSKASQGNSADLQFFTAQSSQIADYAGLGDVNGDGYNDYGFTELTLNQSAGSVHVHFGGPTGSAVTGFDIAGPTMGLAVSALGDINGDGLADMMVRGGANSVWNGYVVYDKAGTSQVNVGGAMASSVGYQLYAPGSWPILSAQGIGDVNGDGYNDMFVTTQTSAAVIFGGPSGVNGPSVNIVSPGAAGFAIDLATSHQTMPGVTQSKLGVSSVGDFNGDGISDFMLMATAPNNTAAEILYIVYGKAGNATVSLNDINNLGVGGLAISMPSTTTQFNAAQGYHVLGDINGDGFSDIGVQISDTKFVVIYGNPNGGIGHTTVDQIGTDANDTFTSSGTQTLVGGLGNDTFIASGADVLYGGGGNDVFAIGASTITALQSKLGFGGNTTQLATINGGSGVDTIRLSGGASMNLDTLSKTGLNVDGLNSRVESIERFDLTTDTAANTLTLNAKDVLDMSGAVASLASNASLGRTGGTYVFGATEARHLMIVDGNSNDTVITSGGFTDTNQTVVANGHTYEVFNQGTNVQLWLDSNVTAAPTLQSSTPGDEGTLDARGNLVLNFSENILLGSTGTITLKALDGAADIVINLASANNQLSVSGRTLTINPTSDLA